MCACTAITSLPHPITLHGTAAGRPLVIAEPMGEVAQQFMTLGAAVVQEIAKLKLKPRNSVRWGSIASIQAHIQSSQQDHTCMFLFL